MQFKDLNILNFLHFNSTKCCIYILFCRAVYLYFIPICLFFSDLYRIYYKNCGAYCLNAQSCAFSKNVFYSNVASNRYPFSSHIVTKLEFSNPNIRQISSSSTLFSEKPSSKVEETVNAVKEKAQKEAERREVVTVKPKKTIKQKVIDEVMHYYHGFKLLGLNAKISFKLALKKMNGHELTRREHNLVSSFKYSLYSITS